MSLDITLPENLSDWMSTQRWYGAKGTSPLLERIGGWVVYSDDVAVSTHYLLDHTDGRAALYQVPLTTRSTPLAGVQPIAAIDGRFTYDAPSDPVYAATLLRMILGEDVSGDAAGHRQPGAEPVEVISAAVLSGEQSNTSIICQVSSGPPVIVKVFRALHNGENPDVTLQSAIAAAGSDLVPRSLGHLSGAWTDSGRADGRAAGHLAFAQEFLPGVEDAWRVALRAAEAGDDFTEGAYALGVATADVHAILADVMPTRKTEPGDIDAILESMLGRSELAIQEVPSLDALRPAIARVIEAARVAPWPILQRIHGDYHLGQVLAVPGRGWVLLDFEGEPLRPMHERSQLDVGLRDVAGMLRSFDYAAGSVILRGGGDAASQWATAARNAFLDGYVARSSVDVRENTALLDAFEMDKALYEAVYEARNRPGWLEIPATAIRRLAGKGDPGAQ